MRVISGLLLTVAFATGCSSLPFGGPSTNEKKAECDRVAAQAIQTESLEEAKMLSAQASSCYAKQQAS
jgi:hypothetical protein